MLFRPEEVVLPSASTAIDVGFGRNDLDDLTPVEDDVDAVGTVSARIINHHPLIAISAADQQQEINRSGYVELLAALQGDGVEIEAQSLQQTLVARGEAVIASLPREKATPREEA